MNKNIAKLYEVRDIKHYSATAEVLHHFSYFDFLYDIKNICWTVNSGLSNLIRGPWLPFLMEETDIPIHKPEIEIEWADSIRPRLGGHHLINIPLGI